MAGVVVAVVVISESSASHPGSAVRAPAPAAAPYGNPGYDTGTVLPHPTYPDPVMPTVPEPPTTSSAPDGPLDPNSAEAALRAQVATDRSDVEALVDNWVPQLSAKKPGLVADGITYGYPEIWQNYRSLKSRYPAALLAWSGDFASFKYGDFWITLLPTTYPDGQSANAWCDSENIPVDDCYAKLVSHTHGHDGATLIRPR